MDTLYCNWGRGFHVATTVEATLVGTGDAAFCAEAEAAFCAKAGARGAAALLRPLRRCRYERRRHGRIGRGRTWSGPRDAAPTAASALGAALVVCTFFVRQERRRHKRRNNGG